MDYEKKYNEALERAKKFKENPKAIFFEDKNVHVSDYIFPELKESEDEKIREDIIYFLSRNTSQFGEDIDKYKSWIAWLDKQGQVKESAISQHENTTCKENDNSLTGEDERIKKELCKAIWTYIPTDEGQEYIVWLEKQGEQKHIEMKSAEDSLGITSEEYNKIVDECIYGEQNVDKVKPKFHEGQWIINSEDTVAYINDVKKDIYGTLRYYIEFTTGTKSDPMPCFIDPEYHLWTINDAKAGDVLASNSSVFIFQKEYIAGKPTAYCGIVEGDFYQGVDGCWTNEQCYPVTKGQRARLFSKMHEAGYEWDAEKLELKKITSDNAEQDRLPSIWHDVTEELPPRREGFPLSEDVLVYDKYGIFYISAYDYSHKCWRYNNYFVTHWAYIPKPPKTERTMTQQKKPYIPPTTEVIETNTEEPIACSYYDDHHNGKPGHGWGDKSHDHVGPPGQNKKHGITDIWEDL